MQWIEVREVLALPSYFIFRIKKNFRCVTVGGSHRQRIAHVLCSLLKSAGSFSGAIQQMVLKCIFDDEMIPVKAIDEDTSICFLSFDIPSFFHGFFLSHLFHLQRIMYKKKAFFFLEILRRIYLFCRSYFASILWLYTKGTFLKSIFIYFYG